MLISTVYPTTLVVTECNYKSFVNLILYPIHPYIFNVDNSLNNFNIIVNY